MTCKIVPDMTYNVFGGTLNLAQSIAVEGGVARFAYGTRFSAMADRLV